MKSAILSTALLALICWPASADSLYLKDGRVIRGTFMGGTSRDIRFMENGRTAETFPLQSVDNVVFGNGRPDNPNAGAYGNDGRRPDDRRADDRRVDDRRYDDRRDTGYQNNGDLNNRSRSVGDANTLPAGSVVTVRMIDSIDSDRTNEGRTYRASLDEPIVVNGAMVADRGSDATVKVVRVQQSGKISGNEEVQLVLAGLNINGRMVPVNTGAATVAEKSKGSQSAKVIGGTAVVGAIIGAIAGGGKGAAIGAASGAGAGAAVQAIRGQRVQIASESTLDFTLNDPVYLNR